MRRIVGALFVALALTACNAPDTKDADTTKAAADWTAFNSYAASLPSVDVTTVDLPRAPKGFTEKQVRLFARDEVDLLRRSVSSNVATMEPEAAVAYVTDKQYSQTSYALRSDMARAFAGSHWEWNVASLLTEKPTRPARIVKVIWKAASREGSLGDGTKAPVLDLALQAHIVHTIGTGSDRRSFIVRRSIQLSGFNPGGGPRYWPYLTMRVTTWGNNGCDFFTTAKLVPLTDRSDLASDLAAAKVSVTERRFVAEGDINAKTIQGYVDRCESERKPTSDQ